MRQKYCRKSDHFLYQSAALLGSLAVIIVMATSLIGQTTTPLDQQTPLGLSPGSPSPISDFANVNLFNGNLSFAMPLATAGGRGELAVPLTLNIERHFHVDLRCDLSTTGQLICRRIVNWDSWGGLQVGYGPGVLKLRGQVSANSGGHGIVLTFTDPSGAELELRDSLTNGQPNHTGSSFSRGTNFVSTDGSSISYVSETTINDVAGSPSAIPLTGVLLFPNGTRYRIENGLVKWIRDRSGNTINYSYEMNRVKTVTDPLGRTITVNYDVNDQTYGVCDQIVVPGFGGTTRTITIKKKELVNTLRDAPFQTKSVNQLFPEIQSDFNASVFNPPVVSNIYLPNGQSYTLSYNVYGELSRIQLPSGGAVEYDYQGGFANQTDSGGIAFLVYRRVIAKRVYTDASNANTLTRITSYSRPENLNNTNAQVETDGYIGVEEKDAASGSVLGYSKHYFYGSAGKSLLDSSHPYRPWKDGKEWKTESLDDNETTVLRVLIRDWRQRAPVAWWVNYANQYHLSLLDEPPNDPRVVETITVIEPAGANLVAKNTSINPQTLVPAFDQNKQTDSWQYDYGIGSSPTFPRRHIHTDFLGINPTNDINYPAPANGNFYSANDPHVIGLVKAQQTFAVNPSNGAETLVSQNEIRYDESSFLGANYPHVTSWQDPGLARGNPTTVRSWLNTTNSWLESHRQFDQCGNVQKLWTARDTLLSNPTEFRYVDAFSNSNLMDTYAFPTTIISPVPDPTNTQGSNVGLVTSKVYDANSGLVVSLTDPNGKTTTYDYTDSLARLKVTVLPNGGRIQLNYFDSPGNVYVQVLTDQDPSRTVETRKYFDGLGRVTRRFLYDGTPGTPWTVTDSYYDALGRPLKTSNPYRTNMASALVPINCSTCTTASYDSLGRRDTLKTFDGSQITSTYELSSSNTLGELTTITDQAGRKRRRLTDAFGNVVRVDEPNETSGSLDVGGVSTSYLYDVLGDLRKVSQGSQNRFYLYDSLGRLLRTKNPEQDVNLSFASVTDSVTGNSEWSEQYAYDQNGNVTQKTDARNISVAYQYDRLNRPISADYSNTTINPSGSPNLNVPDVQLFYDGATNGKGQIWYVFAGGDNVAGNQVEKTLVDSYDSLGKPKILQQIFKTGDTWSSPYQVSRIYNLAGNVTTQTYPSGHSVSYNYDIAGRLGDNGPDLAFRGNLGGLPRTYLSAISYSAAGAQIQEKFGTDIAVYSKISYNSRQQISEIMASTTPGPTSWDRGKIVNDFSLQCSGVNCDATDNNGNLRRQTIFVPDFQGNTEGSWYQQYEYDQLNRLKQVREFTGLLTTDWAQAYKYDVWGNRTIDQDLTWGGASFEPAKPNYQVDTVHNNNRLTAPTDYGLTYDKSGNVLTDTYIGPGARVYDAVNRMTEAADGLSKYSYNGYGQRVRRSQASNTTWQIYGFDGELIAEYKDNDLPTKPQVEYGYRNRQLLVTASMTEGWGTAPPFTGPNPLTAGSEIKLEHLTDLRSVVNQLRTHAGLSAFVFTVDPTPERYVTTMKADHIRQLRTALEEARLHLGLSSPGYAHPTLTENTSLIYAIDLQELREQVLSIWQTGSSAAIQWLLSDQLGTPRMVFDESGALNGVSRRDYLPFGDALPPNAGRRVDVPSYGRDKGLRQAFTSQEHDTETNLDYFNARYFSSSQGRFTSVDPFGGSGFVDVPQSWNKYTYVLNRPFVFTDPSGMIWLTKDNAFFFWVDDALYKKNRKDYKGYYQANGAVIHVGTCTDPAPCNGVKNGDWVQLNANGTLDHIPAPPIVTTRATYDEELEDNRLYVQLGSVRSKDGNPLFGPPNKSSSIYYENGGGQTRHYGPDGKPWVDIDWGHHPELGPSHVHWWDPNKDPRTEGARGGPQPTPPDWDMWDNGEAIPQARGSSPTIPVYLGPGNIPPFGASPVRVGVPLRSIFLEPMVAW